MDVYIYSLLIWLVNLYVFFFFQAEDGIRDIGVTGVQTCALPILRDFLYFVFNLDIEL